MNVVKLPSANNVFRSEHINVAVCGPKRSGKTEVAKILGQASYRIADTGLTLHRFLREQNPLVASGHGFQGVVGGLSREYPEGWDRAKGDVRYGKEFRDLAFRTSRSIDKLCPGLFELATLDQVALPTGTPTTPLCYISVRNPDQWKRLQQLVPGIKLWLLARPGCSDKDYRWAVPLADWVVGNTGTIVDLRQAVNNGLHFHRQPELQKTLVFQGIGPIDGNAYAHRNARGEGTAPSYAVLKSPQQQAAELTRNYYDSLMKLSAT